MLRRRQGKQEGTRAIIDVLLLAREHGPERVRQAVEEALELGCSDVGAVRNRILSERRPRAAYQPSSGFGMLSGDSTGFQPAVGGCNFAHIVFN